MHTELLDLARRLAAGWAADRREVDARHAISTAYYAFFHALSDDFATFMVGERSRRPKVWARAYRQLDHGQAKQACEGAQNEGFGADMIGVARMFVLAQRRRHDADYDPDFAVAETDVVGEVESVAVAITQYLGCSEEERRAFAVHLLFRRRS